MSAPDRPTPTGGPWTRHGHDIPGVTVAGGHPPAVARCGGPALCRKCREDVELAHGGTSAAPDRPTREQVDATLRVAEDGRGDAHDARLLAVEVRALCAELEAVAAFEPLVEARRYIAALQVERDEARAALAARTPPAEPAQCSSCDGTEWACYVCQAPHEGWLYEAPRAPLPAAPDREDDDRPVRWAWAAWLAESAEQADDLDDSERHGLRIAATHLLEDDIAARLNPGDFDPVADPAWALRFSVRLWADVEAGRAARRVSAPPDGKDVPARLDAAAERHEDRWAVFCGDPSDAEDIVNVFDDRFEAEELAQRVIDARIGHRRITITEPAWMILACCGACGAVLDGEACCDGRLAEIEAGEAVLAENAAVAAALAARPTEREQ